MVGDSVVHQDSLSLEIWLDWVLQDVHSSPHDEAAQDFGVEGHESGAHIGSVAVTEGDEVRFVLLSKERREIVGLLSHIGFVEDALGKTPEPAGHALFIHYSAGADDGGSGQQFSADANEIVLGSSGSVEEQEGAGFGGIGCRLEMKLKTHGN